MAVKLIERIGEINYNKFGSRMQIIEYSTSNDILVIFDDSTIVKSRYDHFKKGEIRNPYEKRVYNFGYLGEGPYVSKIEQRKTPQYVIWNSLLRRSYDNVYIKKHPTYKGCSVCEEWHNFQNFGKWYEENYYEIPGEKVHLDKDILVKGNKVYSPDTCVFVPQRINNLIIKQQNKRGDLPIGVHFSKRDKKYISQCNYDNKRNWLGGYTTIEEAFQAYKEFKEKYIKEVAEEYKNMISQRLYEAMYKYEVKITD